METLFIGKNIIFLPQVESTNSYAIDLLKNVNPSEGTVVYAAHQSKGRGQRGSSWNVEPERSLTASFILKPSFLAVKNQFFLYQILALACYDAMAEILDSSQIDIKIKWPNDILVNERKAAGILIENNIQNNRLVSCIAGVGLNVNQEKFEEDLRAVSLKQVSGTTYSVRHVLELLCTHLEKYYLMLKQSKLQEIKMLYLERLFAHNTYRDFKRKGQVESLLVKGLGEAGFLLLEDSSGKEFEVDVKEVSWMF